MVNLVTVVGRNTHILPHMLKYYEWMVDNIYVVVYRQHELDGVLEEVINLGITPYKVVTDAKFNWERVTELYNEIKATKPDEWWIVADDDELQSYPTSIENIIEECEEFGYDFVTGGFLDRIGPSGTFPEVTPNTGIHKAFPYAGFFRYPMSGACPNKVTLMKGNVRVTPGQHYVDFGNGKTSWGRSHPKRMPIEKCFTQVHHFKWDSSVLERLQEVASEEKDYTYWWEYKKMYDAIADNNFKVNIENPDYLVAKLKEFSYIDYNDYTMWNQLREKIVLI